MHIYSQTMIRMIRDYYELHEDGDTEEWDTVIEVLEKIDKTVDIINCRWDRRVDYIDCPQHKHIYELFYVFQLFGEWKENTGGFTFEFITRQIYEDLQWMVFGIASTGCISPNKPKKMHQGRSWRWYYRHLNSSRRVLS